MHDSLPIALHLDRTFSAPQYPSVFPHGQTSVALALATERLFHGVIGKCATLLFPAVADILDERGAEYFERTRVPRWQRRYPDLTITKMSDLKPKTQSEIDKMVEETKKALLFFDELLAGGGENKGPFLEGEKPGFADVMLAAYMAWIERPLPEFFERILEAGDGSIRRHWEASQEFLNGQGETKEWAVGKI
jgi:glutathione S-transferase